MAGGFQGVCAQIKVIFGFSAKPGSAERMRGMLLLLAMVQFFLWLIIVSCTAGTSWISVFLPATPQPGRRLSLGQGAVPIPFAAGLALDALPLHRTLQFSTGTTDDVPAGNTGGPTGGSQGGGSSGGFGVPSGGEFDTEIEVGLWFTQTISQTEDAYDEDRSHSARTFSSSSNFIFIFSFIGELTDGPSKDNGDAGPTVGGLMVGAILLYSLGFLLERSVAGGCGAAPTLRILSLVAVGSDALALILLMAGLGVWGGEDWQGVVCHAYGLADDDDIKCGFGGAPVFVVLAIVAGAAHLVALALTLLRPMDASAVLVGGPGYGAAPKRKTKSARSSVAVNNPMGSGKGATAQHEMEYEEEAEGAADLPAGWEELEADGNVYYYHTATDTSQWERPTASVVV